jgi:hypothetical protein
MHLPHAVPQDLVEIHYNALELYRSSPSLNSIELEQ